MKRPLVYFILALMPAMALAKEGATVKCSVVDNLRETVEIRLDRNGKIIPWDQNHWVKAKDESIFGILALPLDESPIESERSFFAPNGYSIFVATTMADSISIGVSKDKLKGFYKYQDLGSGSGNDQKVLICKEVR